LNINPGTTRVLHGLDAYLRTTENWIFRLIKHQSKTTRYIASDRFLECDFDLADVELLRSPLQPVLYENAHLNYLLRYRRAIARVTYPWYLQMRLRKQRIDVVHSHFAQVGWRYRDVARRLGAAHVVSFYGWDYVQMARLDSLWIARLAELYASADCFICEGPHGADTLIASGCSESKVRVIRLGVEPDQIPFFRRSKRSGKLRLLQVASLREKKGHVDTVSAFAGALEQWPDMHLTLVGAEPGSIYDSIEHIILSRGIADKVSLLPGIVFSKLHSIMAEHHVFIHPSRHASDGDCEGGAPVVLLDAQATGMPVISTTHCDIPQEVVDGATGILCPEGDVPALVRAICDFCEMGEDRYLAYAVAAREHVERNFDVRDCAVALESLYRDLANPQGTR
jgi:colanic acid/amylovoran biosynthesis glycosyltransferase